MWSIICYFESFGSVRNSPKCNALHLQRAKCILHLRDDFKWIPPFNSDPRSVTRFFISVYTDTCSDFFPIARQSACMECIPRHRVTSAHALSAQEFLATFAKIQFRAFCRRRAWQSGTHTRWNAIKAKSLWNWNCRRRRADSMRNSPVAACFSFCLSCANFHMNHRRNFCAVSLLLVWYGEGGRGCWNNLNFFHLAIAINSSGTCLKECWWQITD